MLETSKTAKIVQFAGECSVFSNFLRKPWIFRVSNHISG